MRALSILATSQASPISAGNQGNRFDSRNGVGLSTRPARHLKISRKLDISVFRGLIPKISSWLSGRFEDKRRYFVLIWLWHNSCFVQNDLRHVDWRSHPQRNRDSITGP